MSCLVLLDFPYPEYFLFAHCVQCVTVWN